MKKTTLKRFTEDPMTFLETAQRERVVITRNGKLIALLVGLENRDEEDLGYMMSRKFWEMIRERRKRPGVRLADVKKELLSDD